MPQFTSAFLFDVLKNGEENKGNYTAYTVTTSMASALMQVVVCCKRMKVQF
jgi:hypothetical protein